jgi:hypothetical protein
MDVCACACANEYVQVSRYLGFLLHIHGSSGWGYLGVPATGKRCGSIIDRYPAWSNVPASLHAGGITRRSLGRKLMHMSQTLHAGTQMLL